MVSRHMQDCFRAHPEEYKSELEDDEGGEGGDFVEDEPEGESQKGEDAQSKEKIPQNSTDSSVPAVPEDTPELKKTTEKISGAITPNSPSTLDKKAESLPKPAYDASE